ncbi:hypothetical protein GCM10007304_45010 [Rhodococcoides trifolii]|uniref:Uncharacterized protein n=1 Tax=Rhodococcoides trifolii TaxID=908250 RepID=A0A917G728_9NOCA|nr:hypothetical protein GCM10007304_45010 [Rhodococcus trifolii]
MGMAKFLCKLKVQPKGTPTTGLLQLSLQNAPHAAAQVQRPLVHSHDALDAAASEGPDPEKNFAATRRADETTPSRLSTVLAHGCDGISVSFW